MEPAKEKGKFALFLNYLSNIKERIFGKYGDQFFGLVTAFSTLAACVIIAAPILLLALPIIGCVMSVAKGVVSLLADNIKSTGNNSAFSKLILKANNLFNTKAFKVASALITTTLLVGAFAVTGGVGAIIVPMVMLSAGIIRAAIDIKSTFSKVKSILSKQDDLRNLKETRDLQTKLSQKLQDLGLNHLEIKNVATESDLKKTESKKSSISKIFTATTSILTSMVTGVCSLLIVDVGGALENIKKIGETVKEVTGKEKIDELSDRQKIEQRIETLRSSLHIPDTQTTTEAKLNTQAKLAALEEFAKIDTAELSKLSLDEQKEKYLELYGKAKNDLASVKIESRNTLDILKIALGNEEHQPTHKDILEKHENQNQNIDTSFAPDPSPNAMLHSRSSLQK
jgi:hypothetical protein